MVMGARCICGRPKATTNEREFCTTCERVFQHEVDNGLRRLAIYLERYAKFNDWLASHGRPIGVA